MKFIDIEEKRIGTKRGGGRAKLGLNEIRISISKSTGTSRFPTARCVFGQDIVDKLRWVAKDKIKIGYSKTQVFLKRSDEGSYTIQNPGEKNAHRLGWPCFPETPFAEIKTSVSSETAKWKYHDNGLLIDWPKEQENGS